jgi:hypothetical protein
MKMMVGQRVWMWIWMSVSVPPRVSATQLQTLRHPVLQSGLMSSDVLKWLDRAGAGTGACSHSAMEQVASGQRGDTLSERLGPTATVYAAKLDAAPG